jgi:hypothetical protein
MTAPALKQAFIQAQLVLVSFSVRDLFRKRGHSVFRKRGHIFVFRFLPQRAGTGHGRQHRLASAISEA